MSYSSTVPMQIPREWLAGIPEEPVTLQQIFRLGLRQYQLDRALTLYRERVGSLGYIAELLGLDKRDLIQEARLHGIEPEFMEQTIKEELGQ